MGDHIELLDWKRRIFELYAAIRHETDPQEAWLLWRWTRDELFGSHPQSPLDATARGRFGGLAYFDYDPAVRISASLETTETIPLEIMTSGPRPHRFVRFGSARFTLYGTPAALDLYWLEGYCGGLFLPFGDSSNGNETYGGGRYLLDTVKGADLGGRDGQLILDFNFAYNPSCAYDPRWVCPLTPPKNRLEPAVAAGEKAFR